LLADLIAVYQEGLTRPLPFFPRSAWEYVSTGGDPAKAAARTWAGNDYAWGESKDAYNQLAFRDSGIEILEGEFEQLASRILGPLQANRVVIR
jgi:exodeoxyribonuclease V gamma subunit